MNKEIKIDNLTPEMVSMLDTMWALNTEEDYKNWTQTLSKEDVKMASNLQKLLLIEMLESDVVNENDTDLARNILKKYGLQK